MAGKITALTVQRRNKRRVNVHLDGGFAFSLPAIEAARLHVGQWLEDPEIRALEEADVQARAHEQALRFLSYRPRSTHEVRQNLLAKGYPDATIDATIERLSGIGLVDDLDFARLWVDHRGQFRPRSAAMLRYELRRKGVSDETIGAALDTADDDSLAYQAAMHWVERKLRLASEDLGNKLGPYLVRRGFSYSVVRATIARVQSGQGPDSEEQTDFE